MLPDTGTVPGKQNEMIVLQQSSGYAGELLPGEEFRRSKKSVGDKKYFFGDETCLNKRSNVLYVFGN